MMRVNLEGYYLLSSIFLGAKLLIAFQNRLGIHDRQVLELNDVVGFIDQRKSDEFASLRIDDGGGSYPLDLSLRLRRPEIANYPEVFFFTDDNEVDFGFRACAKTIIFRQWDEKDIWLK